MKSKQHETVTEELYAVAKITGCFGVKGFVKISPLTHTPERLGELDSVQLGISTEQTTLFQVEQVEFHSNAIIMKFQGIDDRTEAEQLRGRYVFIDKEHLAPPPKGSWFIHDIVGCDVFLEDGTLLGKVLEVWKMSGTDLWEINYNGKSVMLPSAKENIKRVDIKKRKIIAAPPAGLLEI